MAGSCCFPYDCFVPQPQPHLRLSLPLVCLPCLMMPDPQLWHFQMAAASPAPPDTCMHFPTMFLLSLSLSISDPIALRLRLRVANPITIPVRMYACCAVAKHMVWFWAVSYL